MKLVAGLRSALSDEGWRHELDEVMVGHARCPGPDMGAHSASERVLVVDDSEDCAETVAALLGCWGLEVRSAYNGLAALHVADEFDPSVAILDLDMPVLDGFETAVRLRIAIPGIGLVALSADASETAVRRTREVGFDAQLLKPPEPEKLRDVLRALLGRPA